MINKRATLGKKGEALVAEHLKKNGYSIMAMNYSRRCGEIDIIAEKGEVRTFVEVKLRQKTYFATSQVITPSKQKKIIQTAHHYNAEHQPERDLVYRFDVALLEPDQSGAYGLCYIPNAFTQANEW